MGTAQGAAQLPQVEIMHLKTWQLREKAERSQGQRSWLQFFGEGPNQACLERDEAVQAAGRMQAHRAGVSLDPGSGAEVGAARPAGGGLQLPSAEGQCPVPTAGASFYTYI